jgi:hypothetical protein
MNLSIILLNNMKIETAKITPSNPVAILNMSSRFTELTQLQMKWMSFWNFLTSVAETKKKQ